MFYHVAGGRPCRTTLRKNVRQDSEDRRDERQAGEGRQVADRQGDWRQYSVHRRSDTRDKQETGGGTQEETGDRRKRVSRDRRRETWGRQETEEVRRETLL